MNAEHKTQCSPSYHVLTPDQINLIHTTTLELLETQGVEIHHDEARQMLADAGCRLEGDRRVLIPGRLVEDAIENAPSAVTIYSQLGEKAMQLQERCIHFGLGTDLAHTYDLETGQLRKSELNDVQTAARIADALPEIDFIASYALANDSPPYLLYLDSFKSQLEHSTKPIFFTAAGLEDIKMITEMAVAVAGSGENLRRRPFLIHYSEPLSPLIHSAGAVEKLLFCADNQIPITYAPGMMSGATAPVTLAGAMALGNAEALSGIVMHQLRSKGAPIISGIGMAVMDMTKATCIYGCPEYRLILSACAELYQHYGVPVWGTAGVTDANCLDAQAGMEWGYSLLINAMAGANLIHDVGYMGQGLIGHPAALVICDEIISYTKRFMRGFELDDEHFALDTIREVGPGGNFLTARQTAQMLTSEHWYPELCNRDSVNQWQGKGSRDMTARAVDKAREILNRHEPETLPAAVQDELNRIRTKAETDLRDMDFSV